MNIFRLLPHFSPPGFRDFLSVLRYTVAERTALWESHFFSPTKVASVGKATSVIERVFSEAAAQRELARVIRGKGGLQSPALWDLYFASYDRVVAFSDGYLRLLKSAHAMIPAKGVILDCGSGTGNFASSLLSASNGRKLVAIDISSQGLALARAKLELIDPTGRTFEIRRESLERALGRRKGYADGAVLNNVLYSLGGRERKRVLRGIFQALRPGGALYLCDPQLGIQESKKGLKQFLKRIAADAVLNSSPMTELDLALVAYLNRELVSTERKGRPFLAEEEISALVRSCGFQELRCESAYYDAAMLFHLRRP